METTIINTIQGSILDCNLAEGIAIFVPPGLVGLRYTARMFFCRETGKENVGIEELTPTIRGEGIAKSIFYTDNMKNRISSIEDMREQINKVLDSFASLGLKSVAMNGIRCDNRPDYSIRPEEYQLKFIMEYLDKKPGVFEKITLVDLRGGFNNLGL